jgi:hypothetical protein
MGKLQDNACLLREHRVRAYSPLQIFDGLWETEKKHVAEHPALLRAPTMMAPPQAHHKVQNPFADEYEIKKIKSNHHLINNRPPTISIIHMFVVCSTASLANSLKDWFYDPYMVHHCERFFHQV